MSLTIGLEGSVQDSSTWHEALDLARAFAHDMEWGVEPVRLPAEPARLDGRDLETTGIEGLVLTPHFACDPLPLLAVWPTGRLVDLHRRGLETPDERVRLEPQILLSTLFAGPQTHLEILDLLRRLQKGPLPRLTVDEETGAFAAATEVPVRPAFDRAWSRLLERIRRDPPAPGEPLALGGFLFHPRGRGEAPGEFARVGPETKELITALAASLHAQRSGLGIDLSPGPGAIDDLDLVMDEFEWLGRPEARGTSEAETAAHQLGASFGRAVVATLGGHWSEEDDGLVLRDVGAVGLEVDPFQVAAERLVLGPSHGFGLHLRTWRELAHRIVASGL